MNRLRYVLVFAAAVLSYGAAAAQGGTLYGVLPMGYSFSAADMLTYSRTSNGFGTARSAAMGGAFTSLGGDLASISTNPAGLGMYRTSAFGLSTAMSFSSTDNNLRGADISKNRFALNNMGLVLNTNRSSSGVVSASLGFSYNKMADLNYRTSVSMPTGGRSLTELFALQLNGVYPYMDYGEWSGIKQSALERGPFGNHDIGLNEWGSVLSYLTGATVPRANNGDNYRYLPLGNNDFSTMPTMDYDSRGYIGEYNIAGGMNINNVVYLGFGIGIQDIYNDIKINYIEQFRSQQSTALRSMRYVQNITMNGVGINFKAGIIVRPVDGLRIGAVIHTPTFVNLNHKYTAGMRTQFGASTREHSTNPGNEYDYNYTTPTKLALGASYTFGSYAIISADYEVVFNRSMRLTDVSYSDRQFYRREVQEYYKTANNFRIGAEVKPLPMLSIRAGYAYYDSPLKSKYEDFTHSRFIQTTSNTYSAGLGVRLNRWQIDASYMYSLNKYAAIELYRYAGDGIDADTDRTIYDHYTVDGVGELTTQDYVRDIRQRHHIGTLSFTLLF